MSRALVLGGGGVAGIAWETGVAAGLLSEGVELTDADVVVGTSAGSTVAAQILSGVSAETLYKNQIEGLGASELPSLVDMEQLMADLAAVLENTQDPVQARREIGEIALAGDRSRQEQRQQVINDRLPSHEWPSTKLVITAINAETGEFVVFDNDSGVPITKAVAASCAVPRVWPTIEIDGAQYYDGGLRSATNEDLVKDSDRILILEAAKLPEMTDVESLPDSENVLRLSPDEQAAETLADLMDPNSRPLSAREGYRQGQEWAKKVRDFWATDA